MTYIVLDPKGIAYADDSGRQVIPHGGKLDESLITKGLIRQGAIDAMLKEGKIEKIGAEKPAPSAPIISPSNRKAPATSAKKGGKKK